MSGAPSPMRYLKRAQASVAEARQLLAAPGFEALKLAHLLVEDAAVAIDGARRAALASDSPREAIRRQATILAGEIDRTSALVKAAAVFYARCVQITQISNPGYGRDGAPSVDAAPRGLLAES